MAALDLPDDFQFLRPRGHEVGIHLARELPIGVEELLGITLNELCSKRGKGRLFFFSRKDGAQLGSRPDLVYVPGDWKKDGKGGLGEWDKMEYREKSLGSQAQQTRTNEFQPGRNVLVLPICIIDNDDPITVPSIHTARWPHSTKATAILYIWAMKMWSGQAAEWVRTAGQQNQFDKDNFTILFPPSDVSLNSVRRSSLNAHLTSLPPRNLLSIRPRVTPPFFPQKLLYPTLMAKVLAEDQRPHLNAVMDKFEEMCEEKENLVEWENVLEWGGKEGEEWEKKKKEKEYVETDEERERERERLKEWLMWRQEGA